MTDRGHGEFRPQVYDRENLIDWVVVTHCTSWPRPSWVNRRWDLLLLRFPSISGSLSPSWITEPQSRRQELGRNKELDYTDTCIPVSSSTGSTLDRVLHDLSRTPPKWEYRDSRSRRTSNRSKLSMKVEVSVLNPSWVERVSLPSPSPTKGFPLVPWQDPPRWLRAVLSCCIPVMSTL